MEIWFFQYHNIPLLVFNFNWLQYAASETVWLKFSVISLSKSTGPLNLTPLLPRSEIMRFPLCAVSCMVDSILGTKVMRYADNWALQPFYWDIIPFIKQNLSQLTPIIQGYPSYWLHGLIRPKCVLWGYDGACLLLPLGDCVCELNRT